MSVIIPIYDTEKYVEKCLRSVMAQTLSEIEIICVDDASPDASVEIVERLAREDDRMPCVMSREKIRTFVDTSCGDMLVCMDLDLTHMAAECSYGISEEIPAITGC